MNIGDIAELAKVSKAAVSRYFNNGYISEEKKERIHQVVLETGYIPSLQAQTLRTKKTKLIGVILPKINSDAMGRVVAGINEIISTKEYQLLLTVTENNEKKEVEYLRIFDQNRVDGIILVATIFSNEHKKALKELSVPVVLVGQRLRGYNCVYHDDFGVSYELTKHLIQSGCKKIAYIGVTQKDEAVGKERYHGYLKAMEETGFVVGSDQQEVAEFSMDAGYEKMKMLEQRGKWDGVFCATDSLAIGAMMYLKDMHQNIPEAVKVVGVGDSRMGMVTTPSLTTAHLSYKTSGNEAARLLLSAIEESSKSVKEIKMGFYMKMRESTK